MAIINESYFRDGYGPGDRMGSVVVSDTNDLAELQAHLAEWKARQIPGDPYCPTATLSTEQDGIHRIRFESWASCD